MSKNGYDNKNVSDSETMLSMWRWQTAKVKLEIMAKERYPWMVAKKTRYRGSR